MTRSDYIAALTEIRKRTIDMEKAFDTSVLTDATGMESDRWEKTGKKFVDLVDRLFEDIAISEKVRADRAAVGEQIGLFDQDEKEGEENKEGEEE